MASTALADRQATAQEVRQHSRAIRRLVDKFGLSDARLRADGTVVVHSDEPGYRSILRLSAAATDVVGVYVHVIADDVVSADAIAGL
jgi:hypothetical protein